MTLDPVILRRLIESSSVFSTLKVDPPALVAVLNTERSVPTKKLRRMVYDDLLQYFSVVTVATLRGNQLAEPHDGIVTELDALCDDALNQRYLVVQGKMQALYDANVMLLQEYSMAMDYTNRQVTTMQTPIQSQFGLDAPEATVDDIAAALAQPEQA